MSGPPVATFSPDSGATWIVPTEDYATLPGPATTSIAASFHYGGRMVAVHSTDLYHTFDAGCTWELAYAGTEHMQVIAPGYPWIIYARGDRGDEIISVTQFGVRVEDLPFHAIDFAAAQLSTPYALTAAGEIMRMEFDLDAARWEPVGPAPTAGDPKYLAVNTASTPNDPTHMIVSLEEGPPYVSFNDGTTWTMAEGILGDAESVTTGRPWFGQLGHSESWRTPMEVWIYVVRTDVNGDEQRVIARSTDGGLTFADAVASDEVTVQFDNPSITPTPGVTGSVAFTGDFCATNESRAYFYDAIEDTVFVSDTSAVAPYGVASIAYHPKEIDFVYIGPVIENVCEP